MRQRRPAPYAVVAAPLAMLSDGYPVVGQLNNGAAVDVNGCLSEFRG